MSEGEPGNRIKGRLMMAGRKAIKLDLGPARLAAVLRQASPEAHLGLTRRFLATDWYSLDGVDEIVTLVAGELGLEPKEYALKLGRATAYESAGRLGRTLVTLFGSPARLARYVPEYWSTLYDSGRLSGEYDSKGRVLNVVVRDWKGHSELRCYSPLGSMVELSDRFREPKLSGFDLATCVARGDRHCTYRLRYG